MYTSDEGSIRPRRDRAYWLVRGLALLVALAVLVIGIAVAISLSGGDGEDKVTTADVVSPSPSAVNKPVSTKPAAYLLEVTGTSRVTIALTVGGSTTSYGKVKLPWKREIPETAEYIGLTVSADNVTTGAALRCRIDHRNEDGEVEEITSSVAEPGTYVSLGCDKV